MGFLINFQVHENFDIESGYNTNPSTNTGLQYENLGYFITVFVFYFQKLIFGNIKKNQFSCIFEIKNMSG